LQTKDADLFRTLTHIIGKAYCLRVLKLISENNMISTSKLIAKSHLERSQVHRALKALKNADLVSRWTPETIQVGLPQVFWAITDKGYTIHTHLTRLQSELESKGWERI
jgi:DNA-binding IclR family transcriptional regulator